MNRVILSYKYNECINSLVACKLVAIVISSILSCYRAKAITVMALCPTGECIFVGTLGGVTYPLDISFDGMSPEVLSWARARHM